MVLDNEGKRAEAEAVIRETLAIHRKNHGEDHPWTGMDYCTLAGTLGAQNRLDEAATNYRRGLDILEKTAAKRWEQAWAHNGLASILAGQGNLGEAEIHHREALALAKKVVSADDAHLLGLIDSLANILRKNGKLDEARPLAEEAVAICQRHPDRVEPQARRAFATLRDVLKDLGDTASLEKLELTIQQTDAKPKPAQTPEPQAK
jgi:tetratricopeptide (TPR) repeat protein